MIDHPSDLTVDEPEDEGPEDEIMTELRAVRERLWAEVGHDWDRLYARLKEIEEAERAAGREIIPPRGRTQPADAAA